MKFARILPALLLSLSVLLSGCASAPAENTAVEALVSAQQQAMIEASPEALLATLTPDDPWYCTEAANLVRDLQTAPVENYSLTAENIRQIDETTWEATLVQRYTAAGETRVGRCDHRFVWTGAQLLDEGPAFNRSESGAVTAFYSDGYKEMALSLAGTINDYLGELAACWDYTPQSGVAVKLYDDHEVFLQSIKLTLPSWVGGWHEHGESIKLYAAFKNADAYASMMRHEATHTALSELTHDNASYWMQEGFATLLELNGAAALTGPVITDFEALIALDREGRLPSLADQLAANPEALTDSLDVRGYYAYSNAMVVWLLSQCGPDTLSAVFLALEKYDALPGTAAEKIPELNERTAAALEATVGVRMEDGFEDWLRSRLDAAGSATARPNTLFGFSAARWLEPGAHFLGAELGSQGRVNDFSNTP